MARTWWRGAPTTALAVLLVMLTAPLPPFRGMPAAAEGPPRFAFAVGFDEAGQMGDGTIGPNAVLPDVVRASIDAGALDGIVAVATEGSHMLALTSDGRVWAWGSDQYGQLGDGSPGDPRPTPQLVRNASDSGVLEGIVAVAAGYRFSLALDGDGRVWAWGRNDHGQLGQGTVGGSDRSLPVAVKDSAGTGLLTGVASVAAGTDHVLAVTDDGRVWAWGSDDWGELGDGSSGAARPLPNLVRSPSGVGTLTAIASVEGAFSHSLALGTDGRVWAWGNNNFGQIGDGTSGANRTIPVAVLPPSDAGQLSGVRAISSGDGFSLAVTSEGDVLGWGNNGLGQLGVSGPGNRLRPVRVGTGTPWGSVRHARSVSAGNIHGLALLEDGGVVAWGHDSLELGDPTRTDGLPGRVQNPPGTGPLTGVTDVKAGYRTSVFLASVRCGGRPVTILGSKDADTLSGTDGPDVMAGGGGIDSMDGAGGDDTLCGGPGNDTALGGAGADVLRGDDGEDLLNGFSGNDRIIGGAGDDGISGGADDDVLIGGGDSDIVAGDEGNDRLFGRAGDDRLAGGPGNDLLSGGPGEDFLRGEAGDDRLVGGGQTDGLNGGAGADTLLGRADADGLLGGPGPDIMRGGGGDDVAVGGGGRDRLFGEAGDDTLSGGAGSDTLHGNTGADELAGRDGPADACHGDGGVDTLLDGHGCEVVTGVP